MVKIAILQMSSVIGEVESNCNKIKNIMYKEFDNADVLVLPEVWTVGWSCKNFQKSALTPVTDFLANLAKEYDVNIIGGSYISKRGDKYYNTCPVFERSGKMIAEYDKNHLFSYYGCNEGDFITAGTNPVIVELDDVKFGLTICYDIRFPEIYRAYRKAGADVLVNCAAWGASKPIPWEMMTKSRAIENQCYMIALTQSGYIENGEYNLGQSRIIDYKGEELSSIMNGEGITTAELNLDEMYNFREKCTILNDIKENYEVKILCTK